MPASKDNFTIAKNTVIVYMRLIVTSVVGLVTSSLVLNILGASDYGLYFVIGGVIALFTFISGSLQATTVRFINYEMGRRDGNLNKVFCMARQIHLFFALAILLIAEVVGVYYIHHYLNVEPGKIGDALFVFHVSIVAACLGIVNVPYQGLLVAHEKFSHIAVIEIVCALLKLLMVIGLLYWQGNALRAYAAGMSLLTLASFVAYLVICQRHWPSVVRRKVVRGLRQHKEMLIFNNYTLLTTLSLMGRNQGSNLLVNYFFNTVVNAAYGISNTVHVYVNTFAGCFDQASAPQITQSISKGDHERARYLVNHTCRICILLVEIVYFTLIADLDYVLHLWLRDGVPAGTADFCRLTLLLAVVSATSGGMVQYINGLGRIKWYSVSIALLYLAAMVVGVVIYHYGYSPQSIVVVFIAADIANRGVQLLLLRRQNHFPVIQFIREAWLRPAAVFLIGIAIVTLYRHAPIFGVQPCPSDALHIFGMATVAVAMTLAVFLVGLNSTERKKIIHYTTT